jgi:hypothetical protein
MLGKKTLLNFLSNQNTFKVQMVKVFFFLNEMVKGHSGYAIFVWFRFLEKSKDKM